MSEGTCNDAATRWFVDVSAWTPASAEWQRALEQLPSLEQQQVARFMFAKDQRLALGSRLLQRHLIASQIQMHRQPPTLARIDIRRTPERKPFWWRDGSDSAAADVSPCWNFNVSHHGALVAIASHPRRLVGVDVVQLSERPRGLARDFFRAFERHFNAREWQFIRSAVSGDSEGSRNRDEDSDDGQFERFYTLWSLKEAYIKAVGIGLGFELLRAEFAFSAAQQRWQLWLDGALAADWTFEATQLDDAHLVSVALGPLAAMWSPSTSSIFSASVNVNDTHGEDASAEDGGGEWEHKELADLIA
ncbi:hypothetical protein PybrP1_012080 [[Pythium] brassicae (nom. inval.)]|nr:hypothetical protein PybrP1_012080 [[Pythium] brassicae (nom. inval.)]